MGERLSSSCGKIGNNSQNGPHDMHFEGVHQLLRLLTESSAISYLACSPLTQHEKDITCEILELAPT